MAAHNETIIESIFGQIESVVAQCMIAEGKMRLIEADRIPLSALYNSLDQRALFAVAYSRKFQGEFEHRIAILRA